MIVGLLLAFGCLHAALWVSTEPFYNSDETRHVMTGVFSRDLLKDLPLRSLREYATAYYSQYPALGLGVWPPLFYAMEGFAMLLFGTSFGVAKDLMLIFAAIALLYVFALARLAFDSWRALAAAILFAISPIIVTFSQQVMLEMPTIAFSLAVLYHARLFLEQERRRDLTIAATAFLCAILTRFDAGYLVAGVLLLPLAYGKWRSLWKRDVLVAAAAVTLGAAPVYWIILAQFGPVQRSVPGGESGAGLLSGLAYYPRHLPGQIGWAALTLAAAGLLSILRADRRRALWPCFALLIAVYLAFTPIAEREPRHSIFWIPAWSILAVEGADLLERWFRSRFVAAAALVAAVAATALPLFAQPGPFVLGYREAAQFVSANLGESRRCFFDGWLDGDFIYQLRRQDPERRFWTLRGDKLLYGLVSGTRSAGYAEYAPNDQAILQTLFHAAPRLIVVESKASPDLPVANRLRELLRSHPERFRLVAEVPIRTNLRRLSGMTIQIYENLLRDPNPATRVEFEMLQMGRPLGAALPAERP